MTSEESKHGIAHKIPTAGQSAPSSEMAIPVKEPPKGQSSSSCISEIKDVALMQMGSSQLQELHPRAKEGMMGYGSQVRKSTTQSEMEQASTIQSTEIEKADVWRPPHGFESLIGEGMFINPALVYSPILIATGVKYSQFDAFVEEFCNARGYLECEKGLVKLGFSDGNVYVVDGPPQECHELVNVEIMSGFRECIKEERLGYMVSISGGFPIKCGDENKVPDGYMELYGPLRADSEDVSKSRIQYMQPMHFCSSTSLESLSK